MQTTNVDDNNFWGAVKKIAETVDNWPEWKKEGWAVLDKREVEAPLSSSSSAASSPADDNAKTTPSSNSSK
jgi:hypothetical protein